MQANQENPVIGSYVVPRRRLGLGYLLIATFQAAASAFGRHHDYVLAVAFALMGLFWMISPATGIASTGVRLPTVRPWRRQVLWSGATERRFAGVVERNRILQQQLPYSSGGRG
jgi:hypothetical protein